MKTHDEQCYSNIGQTCDCWAKIDTIRELWNIPDDETIGQFIINNYDIAQLDDMSDRDVVFRGK